jgi:hypothetical protein
VQGGAGRRWQATHIEALRALAQGGVVLLDKVPADLVLGDLGSCLLCGLGTLLLEAVVVRGAIGGRG